MRVRLTARVLAAAAMTMAAGCGDQASTKPVPTAGPVTPKPADDAQAKAAKPEVPAPDHPSDHGDMAGPDAKKPVDKEAKIAAARATLSADDQKLVEAQEWCAVSTKSRLGGMGAPVKLTIDGKPVFLCCKSCVATAEAEHEKTLAAVEANKARKIAEAKPAS